MNARRNYYMTSTNDGTNSRPDPHGRLFTPINIRVSFIHAL